MSLRNLAAMKKNKALFATQSIQLNSSNWRKIKNKQFVSENNFSKGIPSL